MNNKISKAAMMQALRYGFLMTYEEISVIFRCSSRNVWNKCNGEWEITDWENRKGKKDIISFCRNNIVSGLCYEIKDYRNDVSIKKFKTYKDAKKYLKDMGFDSIFFRLSCGNFIV